jgi:hypothetical protein
MPSLQEILAGYERVNAWELGEERQRLPELTIEEGIRQYLEMWELAHRLPLMLKRRFLRRRWPTVSGFTTRWSGPHR